MASIFNYSKKTKKCYNKNKCDTNIRMHANDTNIYEYL